MKHIFFVEDDLSLINGLSFAIKKQGYALTVARTSVEAEQLWENGNYDLVILDVTLPDGSGFDLCRKIRASSKVPIMFLTAADEETDIIMGLDIGGDDYMTKPFKLAVFLSRINALLRRSENFNQEQAEPELQSNGIRVQLLKQEVTKNGVPLDLTASEYKLLRLSHNHHFKWWFGLALIRTDYMRAQKGGYRKRCHWSAYKAVLLESSFLDSSACSLIYFFIASSVILPIVET